MTILEQAIASLLAVHTQMTGKHVAEVVTYRDGDGYRVKVKESPFDDKRAVAGDVWIRSFLRDQGVNADLVRRVVIDGQMNEALRVYVEYIGNANALQFQPFDLTLADVVEVGKSSG